MTKGLLRKNYLKSIKPFIDKSVIKVIIGMRRSGKSYFLRQIIEKLIGQEKQVVYIDKENLDFKNIRDFNDLDEYIKSKINKRKKTYLFIDEIQDIQGWEKAIASYQGSGNFDIYITGSNSELLSSELSTLISGRYVEFYLYTLSFNEFIEFRKRSLKKFKRKNSNKVNLQKEFLNYLAFGGLPGIHEFDLDRENIYKLINAIFSTIVLKDLVARYEIRNVRILENIYSFIFDNIANIFSAKKIADYYKSQNIKVSVDTVLSYISHLEAAMLCKKVPRYDLKGKRLLEVQEKYFLNDIGFRNALLGFSLKDINALLENVVYLHLKMAGYQVYIGKMDNYEIDFVAKKRDEIIYYQVCYLLNDEKVVEREFRPLLRIEDAYPKYVLSMDELWDEHYCGIKRLNIIEFLCEVF
ncbi:MAG: ATP-binding protein [Candidatus Caenarcaniphilales bacterium]|nr:ATP-binding protein [Candidatus Caenarcaniphilales bacterium]